MIFNGVRHPGWAAALVCGCLAAANAAAWGGIARAACPPPKPPGTVAQQAELPDGAIVRSVAGPNLAPYLEILDRACHPAAALGTSGGPARKEDAADPSSLLRFKVAAIPGLPQPLIITSIASRGGSDTSFSTQLIAGAHGRYRALLGRPVESLLEGGVYAGPLGGRLGTGIAVWGFIWAASEAHVSPHRYTLQRLRWTGSAFVPLPALTTKRKYTAPGPALAELGVSYSDLTRDLPDFDQFR